MGPQQGLLDLLGLELELFHQQAVAGGVDQIEHRLRSVIGHHQQPLMPKT